MKKYVYFFGLEESQGKVINLTEGNKDLKNILGGKGANLAEMSLMNIRAPQGFTISAEVCQVMGNNALLNNVRADLSSIDETQILPEDLIKQIESNLDKLERVTGCKFSSEDLNDKMFLVSVRSGAAQSLPGMMDTILNLGLSDTRVEVFAKQTNNSKLAWDSYRRLIQMFSNVVLQVPSELFEEVLQKRKEETHKKFDNELSEEDLKWIVEQYKHIVQKVTGKSFPMDPKRQLYLAILSVFRSWNNERAIEYRKLNGITGLLGTAVNIQKMVFGNRNEESGTGVAFSRNPVNGQNVLYGEFLRQAQGEDVVAGIRTPLEISQLKVEFPHCFDELINIAHRLEQRYHDMQDMEFTVEDGVLYMLQTRNGKRTMSSAVQIAFDMVQEGLIDEKTAVLRIDASQVGQVLHKQINLKEKKSHVCIGKGLNASPGAAVGKIVFNSVQAVEMSKDGPVILVRKDTSAEDLIGMSKAVAILTQNGGRTSHAAVVSRQMGKPTICGCQDIRVDEVSETITFTCGKVFRKGDFISLDGSTGEIFEGQVSLQNPEFSQAFLQILEWEKKYRKLGVRTNSDTIADTKKCVEYGGDGIGLCRVEHMFFQTDRLLYIREMILAPNLEGRLKALSLIKPYLKEDFIGMFKLLNGKPFCIRLLDPPLHEFLPSLESTIEEISKDTGVSVKDIKTKIEKLREFNPLIGHRGVRLGVTNNEITQMQVEAFLEAAVVVKTQSNIPVHPEIMVPMVSSIKELENQKVIVMSIAEKLLTPHSIPFQFGTMIETPRACLTSDILAKEAEFFSFGTNDLTQLTFGFSRDDAPKWVPLYLEKNILESDPFQQLDQQGVGQLVKLAVANGRSKRPDLIIGLCGEQGNDTKTVEFLHNIGLDYVSVSPFGVLNARIAAAQASIKQL